MNVNKNIIKAMFISGVFAGLAGVFEVLGVFHYQVVAAGTPGYGFDGIAVSLARGEQSDRVLCWAQSFSVDYLMVLRG